jgi:hypothetical protein
MTACPSITTSAMLNLRCTAVGRKNSLFVGSDDGGRVDATFTSLLANCRMLSIEPWSYLRDLPCLLPRWPAHRVLELAPIHWQAISSRDDVKPRSLRIHTIPSSRTTGCAD